MGQIKVNWTKFKDVYNTFETPISYLEETEFYDIWMFVNGREYITVLPKETPRSSDQVDFEDNYKSSVANTINVWTSARATSAGELIIAQPPPSAPPNTVALSKDYFDDMASQQNDYYTITNGKTLVIQRFKGAAEEANDSTKIELYEDVNGDGNTLNLIELMYLNSSQHTFNLDKELIGDGSRRVLIRRTPYGGGAREVFAKWEGFEK
ncbi:MAG: hypothetical protein GY817_01215 [bacterium]|nr:hypothetical protein [bacterium]